MSILVVNCDTWNRMSDFGQAQLSEKHLIHKVLPETCHGVRGDNDKLKPGCIACGVKEPPKQSSHFHPYDRNISIKHKKTFKKFEVVK